MHVDIDAKNSALQSRESLIFGDEAEYLNILDILSAEEYSIIPNGSDGFEGSILLAASHQLLYIFLPLVGSPPLSLRTRFQLGHVGSDVERWAVCILLSSVCWSRIVDEPPWFPFHNIQSFSFSNSPF